MKQLKHSILLAVSLFLLAGLQVAEAGNGKVFSDRGLDESVPSDNVGRYPSFVYTGYKPLADKPVEVFYYIPENFDVKELPVLFILNGAQRTGNVSLNAWQRFAQKHGFVLINPQFPLQHYSENEYQFGNVSVELGSLELNKKEKWAYNIVEALFDCYRKATGCKAKGYYMFGHSAGGQFVHRHVLMMPEARVIKAVASNPSAWTTPLPDGLVDEAGNVYSWPYSVKGTPAAKEKALKKALSTELYVHIGTADTGLKSLDMSKGALAQGPRRYHRALRFYELCQDKAKELGIDLGFRLAVVQGTKHSSTQAVYGYPDPDVEKIDDSDLGENSAFLLLFRSDD